MHILVRTNTTTSGIITEWRVVSCVCFVSSSFFSSRHPSHPKSRRRLQSPGLLRVVDLRGEASRSAVDVASGLHVDVLVVDEVPRRRLQPPGLCSVATAKTISELRRLSYAFTVKGEFPDVAHRDGTFGFTEYAYTAGTTQPNVPRTIKEALPGHRGVPDVCFPSV